MLHNTLERRVSNLHSDLNHSSTASVFSVDEGSSSMSQFEGDLPREYELQLIKYEGEVRNHIRVTQM